MPAMQEKCLSPPTGEDDGFIGVASNKLGIEIYRALDFAYQTYI
jgi:hypothetical protein